MSTATLDTLDRRVLGWVARQNDNGHGALLACCLVERGAERVAPLVAAGCLQVARWYHRAPVPAGVPAEGVWYWLTATGRAALDAAPPVSRRGRVLLDLLRDRGFLLVSACTSAQREALWKLQRDGFVTIAPETIEGFEVAADVKVARLTDRGRTAQAAPAVEAA